MVTALDEAGLNVRAAFWYFNADKEKWRLVLSFPLVDEVRHLGATQKVRDILLTLDPPIRSFHLSDVLVQTSESQLVRAIGARFRTAPSALADLEAGPTRVGELEIEDAYVYRAAA